MIYQNPGPTIEFLNRYYREGGAPNDWVKYVQQHQIEVEVDRRKFMWALGLVGWPWPSRTQCESGSWARVLDYGTNTGSFLIAASDMCSGRIHGFGVDVNEKAMGLASERLPGCVFTTHLAPYVFRNEFDLICCWEVLEHVLYPGALLLDLASCLIKGGVMLLCVPNADSLAARTMHEACPMFGMGHLQIPGIASFENLIRGVLPTADIEFHSIISWTRELANWADYYGPFDRDPEEGYSDVDGVLQRLQGYKLVAVVRT
jgi:SAM-dependent methyltransferase